MSTVPLRARVGGRPVLVVEPDASSPGRIGIDLLGTVNRARAEHASVCVVEPAGESGRALCSLVIDEVPRVVANGWLRARLRSAAAGRRGHERFRHARAAFWREWHKEVRRHAGDERLPPPLRVRLREHAYRASARSTEPDAADPFPRRWLRQPVRASLPPAIAQRLSAAAAAAGIVPRRPLVAIDVRSHSGTLAQAVGWLVEQGYQVVQLGTAGDPVPHPAVVRLPAAAGAGDASALDLLVLLTAGFVVCDSVDTQWLAYLTNTPSLLLNARDPLGAYPLRPDCLFTLAAAIHLESGRELPARSLIQTASGRDSRSYGFRGNSPGEIVEAVREMHEGVTRGWQEQASQRQFRQSVVTAAGDADGFVADGRLARWQADAMHAPTP